MPSEPIIDERLLALAASLHAAWEHADAELRSELEQLIRAYVRREPPFQTALQRIAALNRLSVVAPWKPPIPSRIVLRYITQLIIDERLPALAASMHAAWEHADAELRKELEQLIRTHARREPSFRAALQRTARQSVVTPWKPPVPNRIVLRYITRRQGAV
jgi:hypothetical protein